MKISHIGAKNCVTGSCRLVRIPPDAGGVNFLVDCGIAQGHDPVLPSGTGTMKTEPIARPLWTTPWPTMASCTSRHSPWAAPRS